MREKRGEGIAPAQLVCAFRAYAMQGAAGRRTFSNVKRQLPPPSVPSVSFLPSFLPSVPPPSPLRPLSVNSLSSFS